MSPSDRSKPPNADLSARVPEPADPPTDEERRAAEALRDALEGRLQAREEQPPVLEKTREAGQATARADLELARSIRAAAMPASLSTERHQQILDSALARRPGARGPVSVVRPEKAGARRPGNVKYLAWGGAASVLAMAAAVALAIRGTASAPMTASVATKAPAAASEPSPHRWALSRSAADLFPEGIPRSGKTTERVDRIAYARAQDFRENQFARWGTP